MTTLDTTPHLPGRLGSPGLTLGTDPRSDARMVAALAAVGLDGPAAGSPFGADAPLDQLLAFVAEAEGGFGGLFDLLFADLPPLDVTRTTEIITGVDGNEIPLYVHRPTGVDGPLPCVLHLHGGGMVMLQAANASYVRWRDELATRGMVVVGVEFRNGGGALGPHPFPAGLDDCASALQWVTDNKARLGVSKVVVSGESGGGNLTLATTLKAKADGRLDQIDGVYAQCPYISGLYGNPPAELTSLFENSDYFLNLPMMAVSARIYDPDGGHATNPLAWPYHATVEDLAGLPPHVISLNELDPLRDEGLVYYRKLSAAGVSVASRTVNGTCHAGDCLLARAMPDVYAATLRDIGSFAGSL